MEFGLPDRMYTVLFLSQSNSARRVIAAALLNPIGQGPFRAFTAGVRPAQAYDSLALQPLERAHVPSPAGAPRHYSAIAAASAASWDFVFALTDTVRSDSPT